MAVTLKDVAELAGLSITTVSKYLNGGHVIGNNRERIESAIRTLGYRVNTIARGLKTRRSMTVGILIPSIEQVFSTEIIAAVESSLYEANFSTLVCDCQLDEELESRKMEVLLEKQVDGIIMMPFSGSSASIKKALDRDVPVVLIDRTVEGLNLDRVLTNNFQLAYDATTLLIQQGHKRIGIILGPENLYTSQKRFDGYLQALRDNDLPIDRNSVRHCNYQVSGAQSEIKALLYQDSPPSALFTTNYETTFAAIMVLNELGIRVPKQLSLMGFDGLSIAGICRPRLTTLVQPVRQIGEMAARLILDRILQKAPSDSAREVVLEGHIAAGASIVKYKG